MLVMGQSVVQFPSPNENYYSSLQLFLSCGQEVIVYSRSVGYSDYGPPASSVPVNNEFSVNSWTNGLEDEFYEAQNIIDSSPEVSLESNFDFAVLQTLSFSCFPPDTFSPLEPETIVEEIISSPVPTNPDDILIEASIIAITTTPPSTTSPTPPPQQTTEEQQQIIERLNDYLEVFSTSGDIRAVEALGASITDTTSNIIAQAPPEEVLDEVYELVENLEMTLLCSKTCGEEASVILGDNVQIGASLNSLEDLKEINLGQLSFSLPDNLDELQDSLGGEDACVQVGYSLISTEDDGGVPTASLSFFSVDCLTGTWEEVPITLSDTFIITIPIESGEQTTESECGEDIALCYSGQSLSSITDPDGCELISKSDSEVVCGCTHLTAFSALFVPNEDSCGGWEWGTMQTVAASLLGACVVVVMASMGYEHYGIYIPIMREMETALGKKGTM